MELRKIDWSLEVSIVGRLRARFLTLGVVFGAVGHSEGESKKDLEQLST